MFKLTTSQIILSEKDILRRNFDKKALRDKQRVSFRLADGSRFVGSRCADNYPVREADWMFGDNRSKRLNGQHWWRGSRDEEDALVGMEIPEECECIFFVEPENEFPENENLTEDAVPVKGDAWGLLYSLEEFANSREDGYPIIHNLKTGEIVLCIETPADLEMLRIVEEYGFPILLDPNPDLCTVTVPGVFLYQD